jgi:hypothetical protein
MLNLILDLLAVANRILQAFGAAIAAAMVTRILVEYFYLPIVCTNHHSHVHSIRVNFPLSTFP